MTKSLTRLKQSITSFSQTIGGIGIPILDRYVKAFDKAIQAWQKGFSVYGRLFRLFRQTPLPDAPQVVIPSLPPNLEELLFGPKGKDKKPKTGASDLTNFELQLNRLRRASEDAQVALDADLDAIREKFKAGEISGEEFFKQIVAREEEFVRLQQSFISEECEIIERSVRERNRRTDELEMLGAREAKIINESTRRVVAADREVLAEALKSADAREKAEEEHRRRLEQIAKAADDREIARIKRLADERTISFEEAEKRVAKIRLDALKRREGELTAGIITATDLAKQQ